MHLNARIPSTRVEVNIIKAYSSKKITCLYNVYSSKWLCSINWLRISSVQHKTYWSSHERIGWILSTIPSISSTVYTYYFNIYSCTSYDYGLGFGDCACVPIHPYWLSWDYKATCTLAASLKRFHIDGKTNLSWYLRVIIVNCDARFLRFYPRSSFFDASNINT